MRLSPAQRNSFFDAIPTSIGSYKNILTFEDDGGGWHNDESIDTWISWSLVSDGVRWSYNIRSLIKEDRNRDGTITDERGQIERGTINIFICSTDKAKCQDISSWLTHLIEPGRLGLSLDVEGITTGPEEAKSRPMGSYSDIRLHKRVYRTIIELPILYKFTVIETPPLIKVIELDPWMGYPLAEMEHLTAKAPVSVWADMLLAEDCRGVLLASMALE